MRALTPGIGAYLELEGGERLGGRGGDASSDARLAAGEVRGRRTGRLLVGCAEGALELLGVRPAGKRSMAAADYLRGHRAGRRVLAELSDADRHARRAALTRSCGACSSTAPTPTAPSAPRPSGSALAGRDRAFAMRLAYGAVQRRATLDP